jgi:phosphoglycolate phosphatase-like HAD superfamily hydrolase
MHPILLLFDIDGTMLLTGGAGMRAMAQVARQMFGESFRWEGIDPGGHLDPLIYHEAAQLNGIDRAHEHHAAFHDLYIAELELELTRSRHAVRCLPGVAAVVDQLRHRAREQGDVVLGLVTGNYARAVPVKLASIGIDPRWFTVNAFGDEAPTRPQMVALAMRRFEQQVGAAAHGRRVVVIGDTPRDVACAHANGCLAFAVATGSYSVAQLEQAGADHAVPDLADPAPLLTLVDRLLTSP